MAIMKSALLGRRYLVVEDEYLIAADLIVMLELAGATALGPVAHVQHAMEVLVNQTCCWTLRSLTSILWVKRFSARRRSF